MQSNGVMILYLIFGFVSTIDKIICSVVGIWILKQSKQHLVKLFIKRSFDCFKIQIPTTLY